MNPNTLSSRKSRAIGFIGFKGADQPIQPVNAHYTHPLMPHTNRNPNTVFSFIQFDTHSGAPFIIQPSICFENCPWNRSEFSGISWHRIGALRKTQTGAVSCSFSISTYKMLKSLPTMAFKIYDKQLKTWHRKAGKWKNTFPAKGVQPIISKR